MAVLTKLATPGRRKQSRGSYWIARPDWPAEIPDDQWRVYSCVLEHAMAARIPFALGGAMAMATYTGKWKPTQDMDIYVEPQNRDAMVEVMSGCGLTDLFDRAGYDRGWIYRGTCKDEIVDVIFGMANRRSEVDAEWVNAGPLVEVRGLPLRMVPAEEMIWAKLYVMQRDRCDWPDVINILYSCRQGLDWERLKRRIGDDQPLLDGLLNIFGWLFPEAVADLPATIRRRIVAVGESEEGQRERRLRLLDSRPWFLPSTAAAENS